jgi:hypothetical protein
VAQSPQWLGSLASLMQAPAQFSCPAGQFDVHTLLVHTSFCLQALPQLPQLPGSVLVSTQLSPHLA